MVPRSAAPDRAYDHRMRRLASRARSWFALGVALVVLGVLVLDGTAQGVAFAAAAIGVLRVLSSADMSGVTHGGEGG